MTFLLGGRQIKYGPIEFPAKDTSISHSIEFSLDKFSGSIDHVIFEALIKTNPAKAQGLVMLCIFYMVDNRI